MTKSEIVAQVQKTGTPMRREIYDSNQFRYRMTTESENPVAVAFKLAVQQAEASKKK